MSKYSDIRAAITKAFQNADATCPAANIHDRFRDPKMKNKSEWLLLFGETVDSTTTDTGKAQRIHGWHFDRDGKPGNTVDSNEGYNDAVLGHESWTFFGFLSFTDLLPAPSTYEWQEIMDGFADEVFNTRELQDLSHEYNMVLTTVSLDRIGFTFDVGEMKCHVVEGSLSFDIIY